MLTTATTSAAPAMPGAAGRPGSLAGIDLYSAAADIARQHAAAGYAARHDDQFSVGRAVYAYRAALELCGGTAARTSAAAAVLAEVFARHRRGKPARTATIAAPPLSADGFRAHPHALATARLAVAQLAHERGLCDTAAREATAALDQLTAARPGPSPQTAELLLLTLRLLLRCRHDQQALTVLARHTGVLPAADDPHHQLIAALADAVLGDRPGSRAHQRWCTATPSPPGDAAADPAPPGGALHTLITATITAGRPRTLPSPAGSVLLNELAARYHSGVVTIPMLAAETGYAYATIHKHLTLMSIARRGRDTRTRARRTPRTVAYSSWGQPEGPFDRDTYLASVHHAIEQLGHRPLQVDTEHTPRLLTGPAGPTRPDCLIVLNWQPTGHPPLPGRWPGAGIPTLIWDPHEHLPANHPLRGRASTRIIGAPDPARPRHGWWLIPATALLHHPNLRHRTRRERSTTLHILTGPGEQPGLAGLFPAHLPPAPHHAPAGGPRYEQTLAVLLAATDTTPATTHTLTAHLTAATAAGCLPLAIPGTRMADLVPPALHVRDSTELHTRLAWLTGITATTAHRDLLAACRLRLHRHAITTQLATVLPDIRHPHPDRNTGPAGPPRQPAPDGTARR
ncbi:hypothetical protein ACQPZJ_44770 [Actinoplanes sp. CA-054009]